MVDNLKYITVSEAKFAELEQRASLAESNDIRVTIEDRTTFVGPYFSDSIPASTMHLFRYKNIELEEQKVVPYVIRDAIENNKIQIQFMQSRTEELKRLISEQTQSLIKLNDERTNADSKLYLIPMWIRKIFGAV